MRDRSSVQNLVRSFFSMVLAFVFALSLTGCFPQPAQAAGSNTLKTGDVRIHVLPFDYTDAILVECDGHFGMIDSGEDSTYPNGSSYLYPQRPGTTIGQGHEAEVSAYLHKVGVTEDNFDFYIGTHTHSDHIGSAAQIIYEFHPKTIYTPVYNDSYISVNSALFDNLYVYDRLCAAVEWAQGPEGYQARFVQHLDKNYVEQDDPSSSNDQGSGTENTDKGTEDDQETGDQDPDAAESSTEGGQDENESGQGVDPDDDARTDDATTSEDAADEALTGSTESGSTTTEESGGTTGPVVAEKPYDPTDHHGSPIFHLGSATIEIFNYDEDYQVTKVPDANYFSYGVKVTAANGRSAFLAGDINNKTDGESSVGDEDRLKDQIGKVDLFKMGHHGLSGSNSPDYLRAILKEANGEDRTVVVQTGAYEGIPLETLEVINEKGARHFRAADLATWGYDAFVADLTAEGVRVNCNLDNDESLIIHKRIDGKMCLFKSGLPYITTGWLKDSDGAQRYFGAEDSEGSSVAFTDCWAILNGQNVYIDEKGNLDSAPKKEESDQIDVPLSGNGWTLLNDIWFYLTPQNGLFKGWLWDAGSWYYLKDSGAMATGWQLVDGKWYFFDGSGRMCTNWLKTGGKWYYLNGGGDMATGWLKTGGKWYYLNAAGDMATGWQLIDGKWYFLSSPNGDMATGWLKTGGKWYYLNAAGDMTTGWQLIDGKWYYLNASNGDMKTGWLKLGGTWYYLNGGGDMATGWLKTGGKWYYLTSSGAMATGALEIDGVSYSFNSSGAML